MTQSQRQLKFLTVDDERIHRFALSNILSKAFKAEVFEAAGPVEALRLLRNTMPDLILLDYNMPGMTGGELLRRIRANSLLSAVPVIMCTANADKNVVMELVKLKIDGFIVKPYNKTTVTVKVKEVLQAAGRKS